MFVPTYNYSLMQQFQGFSVHYLWNIIFIIKLYFLCDLYYISLFPGTVLDLDHQKGARKEAEVGVHIKANHRIKRNTVINN